MEDDKILIRHIMDKKIPMNNIVGVCGELEKRYNPCKVHFDVDTHTVYVEEVD